LNYYVYYKIESERLAALRALVEKLFQKIQEKTGVQGRWMHRRDDPLTYMEVYEGVNDETAFEALLESEGAKLGVARKVERFVCA
jgi:quinol monooxygenase YgiN